MSQAHGHHRTQFNVLPCCTALGEGLTWSPTHGPHCLPCRTRLGGCTRVSGHKAYRTVDRPHTPWWRSRAGDAAVPVCMCPCVSVGGGHEATDTGLAYAPVSQAHGHHHIVQRFAFVRWLPTYPGQLAPTTLPLCRLVSNSRSAGLSPPPPPLSLFLSLWPSSHCDPLSLSRIQGFSGCSVGLYPPRGSNPPPQDRRGVSYPLSYEELLSALLF